MRQRHPDWVKRGLSVLLVCVLLMSTQASSILAAQDQQISYEEQDADSAADEQQPGRKETEEPAETVQSQQTTEEQQPQETGQSDDTAQQEEASQTAGETFAGETLKFVNLYWETDSVGAVQAVFDGGSSEDATVQLEEGDRGVYQVQIPDGDYSQVTFQRADGSEENLGDSWNYYGQESQSQEESSISFQPDTMNTFYYDRGDNPSYWGQDPDYEVPDSMLQTMTEGESDDTSGDTAEDDPKAGQMLYFVDLHDHTDEDAGNGHVKRIHIAFLKTGHGEINQTIPEGIGEVYTMYEKREGVYSAPFPQNVADYDEVAFQAFRDTGSDTGIFNRHYNFRGADPVLDDNGNGLKMGSFTYQEGIMDTLFYNTDEVDSYWGSHPTTTDESLDKKVLYFNTTDLNGNGTMADPNDLWIKWEGMPQSDTYDEEKGEKLTLLLSQPSYRYYQFPFDSGATENTVIKVSYKVISSDGSDSGDSNDTDYSTFLLMYTFKDGNDCLDMDYIREDTFSGSLFSVYTVKEGVEERSITFDNKRTSFKTIQMRLGYKTDSGNYYETLEGLQTNQFELAEDEYTVDDSGNCWINLVKTSDEAAEDNPLLTGIWGKADVPTLYTHVQFRGEKGGEWYYSDMEEISVTVDYPCFYSDITGEASDTVPEDSAAPGLTGYWDSVYAANANGDKSVDIPEGTFEYDADAYYVNTDFYDYYSDWEMTGQKQKEASGSLAADQSRNINTAVAEYYKQAGDGDTSYKPVYMSDGSGGAAVKKDIYGNTLWNWSDDFNKWTQAGNGPRTGIAGETLSNGTITLGGVEAPYFNESFLRGDNVLGTAVGNVYKNVAFPFKVNTSESSRTYGYWEYESGKAEDAVRLKKDVNKGYYLEKTGEGVVPRNNLNSFLPYNDSDVNNQMGKINYHFGNEFNIEFQLPENKEVYNELKEEYQPVSFEFQGDDDIWIYIVDEEGNSQLVLDMGGIHDANRGIINFKTGEVTVYKDLKGTGYNAEGTVDSQETVEFINDLRIGEKYTLKIFYFERGLYESNLKISFNFPKQNTLSVTKEVDTTSSVAENTEDIFSTVLSYMGGFPFNIQNLVTSGKEIKVEDSAGYVSPGESVALYGAGQGSAGFEDKDKGTAEENDGVLHVNQTENLSGSVPQEEKLLKISGDGDLDLTGMAYLRMAVKNLSDNAESGADLYLSFVDKSGNRIGNYAIGKGYQDEAVSFGKNQDSVLRIDFKALEGSSNFDWSQVSYMLIGLRNGGEYEITNLAFYEKMNQNTSSGFAVSNEQISDYGSYNTGTLTSADGAWYSKWTANSTSGTAYMADNGNFSLANGETAVFTDKFRVGSYISLEESVNPKVFDTIWTIKENGEEVAANSLLSTRDDITTVRNPLDMTTEDYPLSQKTGSTEDGKNVSIMAGDDRTEVIEEGWNADNFQEPDTSKTLVYRSYKNPDESSSSAMDISVEVKNTLKRGSIEIVKKLDASMAIPGTDGKEFKPANYTFDIYYTDVAGLGLEKYLPAQGDNQHYVKQTVTVSVGTDGEGSVVLDNIPAGTQYYIVEQPANGATITNIEIVEQQTSGEGVLPHENVQILNDSGQSREDSDNYDYTTAYVVGTAYNSQQTFVFTNKNQPFYMDLEKVWEDNYGEDRPAKEVHIQIQRRVVEEDGYTDWENVTKDFFNEYIGGDDNQAYVVLNAENDWHTVTSKVLPLHVSGDPQAPDYMKNYEYRIVELGVGEGDLSSYQVSYEVEWGEPGDDGTAHVTYRAVNSTAGLTVKKNWDDNFDIAGVRPEKIRVMLERSSNYNPDNPSDESATWEKYEVNNNQGYIELGDSLNNWTYSFASLPLKDENGNSYYYRISGEQIFVADEWKNVQDFVEYGEPEYSAPVMPEANSGVTLTVTNTVNRGNVRIEKYEKDTTNPLKGARFKIEKLIPGSNADKSKWSVDNSWEAKEGVTTDTGGLDFKELPYGVYRITETEAPSGYHVLKEPIHVTINDEEFDKQEAEHEGDISYDKDSKVITIKIYNEKGLTLPVSGGRGLFGFTLVGLALMGTALGIYLKKQRTGKTMQP